MSNNNLNTAKREKRDEFYTEFADIEKELKHYKAYFRNKVVYCNCDDLNYSKFFTYFTRNFRELGLKKLITSAYRDQSKCLTGIYADPIPATYVEHFVDNNPKLYVKPLRGDGDFRSSECVRLLRSADIIVTNPPFSLFGQFMRLVMREHKDFIVVGNKNAIASPSFFRLMMQRLVFLGVNKINEFSVPPDYEITTKNFRVKDDGTRVIKTNAVCWFTNLRHNVKAKEIPLRCSYAPDVYDEYDNYLALNVDKLSDIPYDYDGYMGVPITYMERHNDRQFELIGSDYDIKTNKLSFLRRPGYVGKFDRGYVKGRRLYSRIIIKKRKNAQFRVPY